MEKRKEKGRERGKEEGKGREGEGRKRRKEERQDPSRTQRRVCKSRADSEKGAWKWWDEVGLANTDPTLSSAEGLLQNSSFWKI